jgi:hypothetical protein
MRDNRAQFTIQDIDEEFTCPECGCPVYMGDRAWMDDLMAQPYCSDVCSNRARLRSGKDGEQ